MRYKLFRAWIICLLACVMSSCSRSPHLSGYIYSFASNYFTVTDLRTGKVIANKWLPKDVDVEYAVKLDSRRIMLSDGENSWVYDRLTGNISSFPEPTTLPALLPAHHAIIYYSTNLSDKAVLYRMSLKDGLRVSMVEANDHKDGGFGYNPIVAISDNRVVFSPVNNNVKYYDIKSNHAGYLPIKDCVAMTWRSKTQQLLCFHAQGKQEKYYLIHLDGTGRVELNKLKPFGRVFWYSPEYDTLVVSADYFESAILRAYNFKTGDTIQFGAGAAPGAGVWFPDLPPAAREALKLLPDAK